MKKIKDHFRIFAAFLTFALLLGIHTGSVAQPPPPPPPGGGHGLPGNQPGGAPVGEGMFILIGLAGLYGCKKVYDMLNEVESE